MGLGFYGTVLNIFWNRCKYTLPGQAVLEGKLFFIRQKVNIFDLHILIYIGTSAIFKCKLPKK